MAHGTRYSIPFGNYAFMKIIVSVSKADIESVADILHRREIARISIKARAGKGSKGFLNSNKQVCNDNIVMRAKHMG